MTQNYEPQQLELSNGIPIILQHYDGLVAATYWWVNTGSADEGPKETGFAHFLEHMLFKDAAAKESGRASTGKTARVIESLGGDINAYTSFDQTVYHVTCAAQHWESVLDHFGVMAKPQRFLAEDFEREREVILEELRKNEDSPGRQLFQTLFSRTFRNHPYGRPVIGFAKILKAATTRQLEEFYRRQYVTEKMGLIMVGPIGSADSSRRKSLLKILEKRFGAKVLRPSKAPKQVRPRELLTREKSDWSIKRFDVKSPTLSLSFRVPELSHADMPALDLLTGVLGMGELSRLYQKLFYETSLVTDVSGGIYVPKDPGMIYFQAEVDSQQKIESAAKEIFNELRRIAEVGPTSEEISRVLVNAESERLYATQTADGMASRLGFLRFVMGNLNYDQEYLERLRKVTLTEVRDIAKRYLTPQRLSGVVMLPQAAEEFNVSSLEKLAEEILPQAESPRNKSKELLKKSERENKADLLEIRQLPSGLTLAFYPRPQSHVFSVHAAVLGGLRLEISSPVENAEKDWGASYLMALTWPKGTPNLDGRAISAKTEGRAASIDGFAGRNSVGLQLTGLARDFGELSELFTDVLINPIFPKDEVDHARRIAEDSVRSLEDHSSQLCSKLFLETLFESHPYGKMTHGSLESLGTIFSDKLQAYHRLWVRPERLVISVSGPLNRDSVEKWVQDLDQRIGVLAQKSRATLIPTTLPNEPALKAPRWTEKLLGREQIHILTGGLGTQIGSEDRYSLRLLQTLLGGQSGRLFIELREKKSLAYTVSPISFEGLEKGYLGIYIACAPEKRSEAEKGVVRVLEQLVSKGLSEAEMKRAKEFYLGRRAMDLQSDSAIASHYGLETLYRLPHLTEQQVIEKIHGISAKELQSVCKKYLVEPYRVTSSVG